MGSVVRLPSRPVCLRRRIAILCPEQQSWAPFSGQYQTNMDFWSADDNYYAGNGYGVFVFAVNGDGKAKAVIPAATRARYA
jgi:hypothetical protein